MREHVQDGQDGHAGDPAAVRTAGIVLCGGRSTRMGSSKAFLPFGEETMLQRVVRVLSTVVAPIVVVAAPTQALPALPSSIIVTRDEREGRGPLEGLRAGMKALPENVDMAYVTSCDVPLLVPGFVRRLIELVGGDDIAVVEVDGFPHPLSAVYRRRTLPHIESLLNANRLRPAYLFESVPTRRVQPAEMASVDPQLLTLRNLNTREDYQHALVSAGLTDPGEDSDGERQTSA
jgi:molybdenum cofactor guanylyltransferase